MKVAMDVYGRHIDDLTRAQRRQAVELWAHKMLWGEIEAEAIREAKG